MHRRTIQGVAVTRLPGQGLLTRADLEHLAAALESFDADASVGAVLLHGTANGFCGGLDLHEFDALERLGDLASALERCFLAFVHLTKPLVVAADGLACGFGATMLCHADVVIVSDQTRIRMPFLDLGLLPEAGSTLLLGERIGHLNAMRLLCLGEEIDAQEAKAIGLATKIVPAALMDADAMSAAKRLARRPHDLLSATMRLLKQPRAELDARIRAEIALCVERLSRPDVRRRLARFAALGRPGPTPGREAA